MGYMTELEQLENTAFANDVDILDGVSVSKRKGCSMIADGQAVIFLNRPRIKDQAEKVCVLAEEIGHIQTGAILCCEAYLEPAFARWIKRKNEIIARRWAIQELLPYEKLQRALHDCCADDFELSEKLGVSIEFLRSALEYYTGQGIEFKAG